MKTSPTDLEVCDDTVRQSLLVNNLEIVRVRKICIGNNTCLSFFSSTFFGPRNTSIYRLAIEICVETHVDLYAVCVIFARFSQNCNVSINASRSPQYCLISRTGTISFSCGRKNRDMNGQSSCEDNRRSVCGCAKTVK